MTDRAQVLLAILGGIIAALLALPFVLDFCCGGK